MANETNVITLNHVTNQLKPLYLVPSSVSPQGGSVSPFNIYCSAADVSVFDWIFISITYINYKESVGGEEEEEEEAVLLERRMNSGALLMQTSKSRVLLLTEVRYMSTGGSNAQQ